MSSVLFLVPLLAAGETPSAPGPLSVEAPATAAQLARLRNSLAPLSRDFAAKERRPVAKELKDLQARLASLEAAARREAPAKVEGVRAIAASAAEQQQAEKAVSAHDAQMYPARAAASLRERVREMSEAFARLFPAAAAAAASAANAPAVRGGPDVTRSIAGMNAAASDATGFFDRSRSRGTVVLSPRAAAAVGRDRPMARKAVVPASGADPRVSFTAGGVSRAGAAAVPAPAKKPARPALSPESQACAAALADSSTFGGMCAEHPTMAPLLAGVVQAFKDQFSGPGMVQLLVFMLIGLALAALSGFGLVAKLIGTLVSLGLMSWMIWDLLKRGYSAVKALAGTADSDPRHAAALKEIGTVVGSVVILALFAALGYGAGKLKPTAKLMSGMTEKLGGAMGSVGLARGGAAADAALPAGLRAVLSRVFPTATADATAAAVKETPSPRPPGSVARSEVSQHAQGARETVHRVNGTNDVAKVYDRVDGPVTADHLRAQKALHDELNASGSPVETVPVEVVAVEAPPPSPAELLARLEKTDPVKAKAARQALETDAMTGAPNRAYVERVAAAKIRSVAADGGAPTVAMMDMNNFGAVNEGLASLHGPTAGAARADAVLVKASLRLKGLAGRYGVEFGRYGGEEFVLIGERASVRKFLEASRAEFGDMQALKDAGITPKEYAAIREAAVKKGRGDQSIGDFTTGVAPAAADGEFSVALHHADEALNFAKQNGGRGLAYEPAPEPGGAFRETPAALSGPERVEAAALKTVHDRRAVERNPDVEQRMAELKEELGSEGFAEFTRTAFRDVLTGARTKEFLTAMTTEWKAKYPAGTDASMVSARGLKMINDALGHEAGDAYLAALGRVTRDAAHFAKTEEPVRYASKDFLFVGEGAEAAAARAATAMESLMQGEGVLSAPQKARLSAWAKANGEAVPADLGTLRAVSVDPAKSGLTEAARASANPLSPVVDALVHSLEETKAVEQGAAQPLPARTAAAAAKPAPELAAAGRGLRGSAIVPPEPPPADAAGGRTARVGHETRPIRLMAPESAAAVGLQEIVFTKAKLRHTMKHAGDFGLEPASASNEALAELQTRVLAAVAQVDKPIKGRFVRGNDGGAMDVYHFFDEATGTDVMIGHDGTFVGAWKLSPEQVRYLRTRDTVGGGGK